MELEFLNGQEPNEAPYSDAVLVDGKMLYLSGLVSEDLESGEIVPGDITEQTRLALTNLKTLLEKYGSDMDHVVRVEIVLTDFSQRPAMNVEYMKHFDPKRRPSRICYGGVELSKGCLIEIMATAVKK